MGYAANASGIWLPFTTVYTGFSVDPTGQDCSSSLMGKFCAFRVWATTAGTSNATTLTCTLPYNGRSRTRINCIVVNNGVVVDAFADVAVTPNTNILTVFATSAAAAFTASGSKNCFVTGIYELQ